MNEKSKFKELNYFLDSLNQSKSVAEANLLLEEACNVKYSFTSLANVQEFYNYAKKHDTNKIRTGFNKEWGDVQTPLEFVDQIFQILLSWDFTPDFIVEPTMGSGNFLMKGRECYPNSKLIYGVEIQETYIWEFLIKLLINTFQNEETTQTLIEIYNDDIFTHEFYFDEDSKQQTVLIIGNPPWITIADLSKYQSKNIPLKNNTKNFTGLDALTGKSNFDITETIIIKLLGYFKNYKGKIALLCKDTVIKNIIKNQLKEKYPITNIRAIKFNSQKIFQKTCNASLFIADFSLENFDSRCSVSHFDDPNEITKQFGWVKDKFVSNIKQYKKNQHLDGYFPFTWRQGVKHDCSKILELVHDDEFLKNKNNQIVSVETDVIFPLLKGSDLRKYNVESTNRGIILTQRKLTDKTTQLEQQYPLLWDYLISNKQYFQKRKSKIYKNDLFSMFGIGDYTFSLYKVAIAGMYKEPLFSLIHPIENKPVILDDTSYFLSFDTLEEAVVMTFLLNSQVVYDFLDSIAFRESKRPYTKEILMRLNLKEIATSIQLNDFPEIEKRLNLPTRFNLDFTKLCSSIRNIIEK